MPSSEDNNQRYNDILRKIATRKPFMPASQPARHPLDAILDNLNTFDALDTLKDQFANAVCYGPRTFYGDNWAGTLLWTRGRGYHGYKILYLTGIWALQNDAETRIIVGQRALEYSAPIFNPDDYHKLIRKQFDLYYDDRGAPPTSDAIRFQAIYTQANRLDLRRDIEQALRELVPT